MWDLGVETPSSFQFSSPRRSQLSSFRQDTSRRVHFDPHALVAFHLPAPVCTPLRLMSCVAITGLLAGMKTTCTPTLRGPLMVRPHPFSFSSSSEGANPKQSLPNSRSRLHCPPRPTSLHIEIPKHAIPDDVLNECASLAERLCWLHLHFLRARHQEFEKCPFQGHARSLQGL